MLSPGWQYLGDLFTNERRMNGETDRWISAVSVHLSVYIPNLAYGHKLWVMIKRRETANEFFLLGSCLSLPIKAIYTSILTSHLQSYVTTIA